MPTKRIPISRQIQWRITPSAIEIWKIVLDLRSQPRKANGELSDEDQSALRAALDALAKEVGYPRLTIEPHRVDDQPWSWIGNNPLQKQRWQVGREIRDALNAALMAQSQSSSLWASGSASVIAAPDARAQCGGRRRPRLEFMSTRPSKLKRRRGIQCTRVDRTRSL